MKNLFKNINLFLPKLDSEGKKLKLKINKIIICWGEEKSIGESKRLLSSLNKHV